MESAIIEEVPLVVSADVQKKQTPKPRNRIAFASVSLVLFGTVFGMLLAALRTSDPGYGNAVSMAANEKKLVLTDSTENLDVGFWLERVLEIYGHTDSSFECQDTVAAFCGITTCTRVPGHKFSACPCAKVKGVVVEVNAPYLMASGSSEYGEILRDMVLYGKEAVKDRMCNLVQYQRVFPLDWGSIKPDVISFPMINNPYGYKELETCELTTYKNYAYCGGAPCFYNEGGEEANFTDDYCSGINDITCLCGNVPAKYNSHNGHIFKEPFEICPENHGFSCELFEQGTKEDCILQGPSSFIDAAKEYHQDLFAWAQTVLEEIAYMNSSVTLSTTPRCSIVQYVA